MNRFGLYAEDPDNPGDDKCLPDTYVGPGKKDTQVQLVISLALGLSAFFSFCVRPSALLPQVQACPSAHLRAPR
jgi:hypothetical protein